MQIWLTALTYGDELEQNILTTYFWQLILFESLILELSVKFASQICHENINKPLDGAYLVDFGADITLHYIELLLRGLRLEILPTIYTYLVKVKVSEEKKRVEPW